jgi:hypothetical protein
MYQSSVSVTVLIGFLIVLGLFRSFAAVGLDDQAENRGVHLVGRPTAAAGCRRRVLQFPIILREGNQPGQSPLELLVLLNRRFLFQGMRPCLEPLELIVSC